MRSRGESSVLGGRLSGLATRLLLAVALALALGPLGSAAQTYQFADSCPQGNSSVPGYLLYVETLVGSTRQNVFTEQYFEGGLTAALQSCHAACDPSYEVFVLTPYDGTSSFDCNCNSYSASTPGPADSYVKCDAAPPPPPTSRAPNPPPPPEEEDEEPTPPSCPQGNSSFPGYVRYTNAQGGATTPISFFSRHTNESKLLSLCGTLCSDQDGFLFGSWNFTANDPQYYCECRAFGPVDTPVGQGVNFADTYFKCFSSPPRPPPPPGPAPRPPPPAPEGCGANISNYVLEESVDRRGNDSLGRIGYTIEECLAYCSSKGADCLGVVHDLRNKKCWFKHTLSRKTAHLSTNTWVKCTPPSEPSESCVAGEFIYEPNIDYKGNDALGRIVATNERCINICNGLPECLGFVRDVQTGKCYFKNKFSIARKNEKTDTWRKCTSVG